MTTGVFSNINSQTNLLTNRANQGVQRQNEQKTQVSQPVVTAPVIYEEEEPDKKTKVLNAVKKAAPVVIPIAAIPLSALAAYHYGKKGMSELTKSVSELTNKNMALQDRINTLSQNITNVNADTIKEEAKKAALSETKNTIDTMKNTMFGLGVAVAGLTGINVADKLKEDKGEENLEKDIEKGIKENNYTINSMKEGIRHAQNLQHTRVDQGNWVQSKYTNSYYGIPLLESEAINLNNFGAKIKEEEKIDKYDDKINTKLRDKIKDSAKKYLHKVEPSTMDGEYLTGKYYPMLIPDKYGNFDWQKIGNKFLSGDEINTLVQNKIGDVNNAEEPVKKLINSFSMKKTAGSDPVYEKVETDMKAVAQFLSNNNPSLTENMKLVGMSDEDLKVIKDKYLLTQDDWKNATQPKMEQEEYFDTVNNIFNYDNVVKKNNIKPSVWSVTSELDPIKEGGLGKVPYEVAKNAYYANIDMPTFVPMYMQPGVSEFKKSGDNYEYKYSGKTYNLQKLASYDVPVYRNSKPETDKVEFYLADDPLGKNNNKIVLVRNDNYFNGTIYQRNKYVEEPEKFAFFSKAVYDFAKIKLANDNNDSTTPVKNLEIINKSAFDGIKSPDAMILNDWQASPFAALARYKAPFEAQFSKNISGKVAEKLENMNIVTIGHNLAYQGKSSENMGCDDRTPDRRREMTSDILNTLFDDYSSVIVHNASSGAFSSDTTDAGLQAIDNVLLRAHKDSGNNHTNFLSMGIHLSNYFCPVSENYAKELIGTGEQEALSKDLQWALKERADKKGDGSNKTLCGVINGNDFDAIKLSNNKLKDIKKMTCADFEGYDNTTNIDEIMEKRFVNKKEFYNKFIVPFSNITNTDSDTENEVTKDLGITLKKLESDKKKLEHIRANEKPLQTLDDETLKETPIISMVGRLATQKGSDIYIKAIGKVFEGWDTSEFKDKNKPIFLIGGSDQEGGQQQKIIKDLKNEMSEENSSRIVVAHGFACQPGFAAGADFFSVPSRFEPCGLTQGESLGVGTPVIASQVGGLVDTLNRSVIENGKERKRNNGILTATNFTTLNTNLNNGKPENENDYNKAVDEMADAIKNALKIFYNDKETYKQMVSDSITENFSWAQEGKQGPLYDYFEKLGISGNLTTDAATEMKKVNNEKAQKEAEIKEQVKKLFE